jgi:hypothetical protein
MDATKFFKDNFQYFSLSGVPLTGKLILKGTYKVSLSTSDNVIFSKRVTTHWVQQVHQSLMNDLGISNSYYRPDFVFSFEGEKVILSMEFST